MKYALYNKHDIIRATIAQAAPSLWIWEAGTRFDFSTGHLVKIVARGRASTYAKARQAAHEAAHKARLL